MKKGDKIKFVEATDAQVNWGGNDDPRKLLEVGKSYTISKIEKHTWHTKLVLKEYPDKKFNSAHFVGVE